VCDLKMSHIGEPHQLASVYIRVEWPPKVCPWGTHFCEWWALTKTYISRATTTLPSGRAGPGRGSKGLSRLNPQVTRFLLLTLPIKGELAPLILYTEIHSWCFMCFSSLLPSTCVNESFFSFYSFLSLSVSNRAAKYRIEWS